MGTPSGGGGYGGGGYPSTGNAGSGLPQGQYRDASGNVGGYGSYQYGMGQQPAYGMGTGGQYSPQLRQAQTAWQDMYGNQNYKGYGPSLGGQATGGIPMMSMNAANTGGPEQEVDRNWRPSPEQQAQWAANPRQPYGMGAQGMGNAYGYGGQQGNPWGDWTTGLYTGGQQQAQATQPAPQAAAPTPPADWNGQAGYDFRHNPATNPNIRPQALAAAPPMQPPPMQAPAPPPPPPRPPAAAPTRANYSPSNPYGGMYSNPQADAWEQQQRSGGLPAPVAPQTDVMRKALSGVDNGYGYGTPGGYQLDTAPSTLDPGSMTGLLGFLGGNVGGKTWQGQAADYANWYRNTYGSQAPGGPTAYPF